MHCSKRFHLTVHYIRMYVYATLCPTWSEEESVDGIFQEADGSRIISQLSPTGDSRRVSLSQSVSCRGILSQFPPPNQPTKSGRTWLDQQFHWLTGTQLRTVRVLHHHNYLSRHDDDVTIKWTAVVFISHSLHTIYSWLWLGNGPNLVTKYEIFSGEIDSQVALSLTRGGNLLLPSFETRWPLTFVISSLLLFQIFLSALLFLCHHQDASVAKTEKGKDGIPGIWDSSASHCVNGLWSWGSSTKASSLRP